MGENDKSKRILEKLENLMKRGNRGTARFVSEEAIAYFARQKENLEKGDPSPERDTELAEVEKMLGDVHKIMGNFDPAIEHYQRMKELCKEAGKYNFLVEAYISMGEIFRFRGNWTNSLDNFKKALKVARATSHPKGEAEASRLIGYVNWRLGNFKKAEDFYEKALQVSESIDDMHIMGKTNIDLGNLANERGDILEAQRLYDKALRLLERVDDKFELARVFNNMGDICIKRQDWVSGIHYFEKCNTIARQIRDPRWKGWALFNAAECYSKSGNPKKAEEYCERAERAISNTEDKLAMAYVEINYGIAFRFLKDFQLSEKRFRSGLDRLEEMKSPSVLAWAYAEYARMLFDKGSKELAIEYMNKAVAMYRKVGAKKFILDLTKEITSMKAS